MRTTPAILIFLWMGRAAATITLKKWDKASLLQSFHKENKKQNTTTSIGELSISLELIGELSSSVNELSITNKVVGDNDNYLTLKGAEQTKVISKNITQKNKE